MQTETFDPKDLAIAKQNGALVDLVAGERVRDGEGEVATFSHYGDYAPLYVWLRYDDAGGLFRIPNAELRRV